LKISKISPTSLHLGYNQPQCYLPQKLLVKYPFNKNSNSRAGTAAGFLIGLGIGTIVEFTPVVDWFKDVVDTVVN